MDVKAIINRKDVQIGAASAVSLGVGVAIGYFVGTKKALAEAQDVINEEFESWERDLREKERPVIVTNNYAEKPPLEDLAEEASESLGDVADRIVPTLSQIVSENGYGPSDLVADPEEQVEAAASTRQNIFEQNEGPNPQPDDVHETELEEFDFDLQADLREQGKPYVVTQEQFFENPDGYENLTFTFYEDGGDLVDDSNGIIPKFENIIGENTLKFGKGSRDNNIVFVRNDEKKLDIEILRSYGSYTSDVLGFKHSDEDRKPAVRKFRTFD